MKHFYCILILVTLLNLNTMSQSIDIYYPNKQKEIFTDYTMIMNFSGKVFYTKKNRFGKFQTRYLQLILKSNYKSYVTIVCRWSEKYNGYVVNSSAHHLESYEKNYTGPDIAKAKNVLMEVYSDKILQYKLYGIEKEKCEKELRGTLNIYDNINPIEIK